MKSLFAALALLLYAGLVQAAPVCVQGAVTAPTANVTWGVATLNTDGTPIAGPVTYDIYMGTSSGLETLLKAGVTSPAVINTGLATGNTYYFYVIVNDAKGQASAPSNEACKIFPKSIPGTVTITII